MTSTHEHPARTGAAVPAQRTAWEHPGTTVGEAAGATMWRYTPPTAGMPAVPVVSRPSPAAPLSVGVPVSSAPLSVGAPVSSAPLSVGAPVSSSRAESAPRVSARVTATPPVRPPLRARAAETPAAGPAAALGSPPAPWPTALDGRPRRVQRARSGSAHRSAEPRRWPWLAAGLAAGLLIGIAIGQAGTAGTAPTEPLAPPAAQTSAR